MERDVLYKSGDLFTSGKVKKFLETVVIGSYEGCFYISVWTLMHMISGIILYRIVGNKLSLMEYIGIHTVWEVWQIYIGMSNGHKRICGRNGLVDTIMDTLFYIIGIKMNSVTA